ncbi:MAG TPA: helix-turn-helix transcriptional regulator [Acidimicrobiia bacterium]
MPKSFLHACLLLLLKEEPGYGYDLVTRLRELGLDDDSAAVYRALRALEERGEVSSYWNTSSTGPARRMYRLTPAGDEALSVSVQGVAETHQAIERYLCRHALVQARPAQPPKTEEPARQGQALRELARRSRPGPPALEARH